MLVLSRKVGERILLGDHIKITVVRISSSGVRLGIEAPPDVTVVREEVKQDRKSHKPQRMEVDVPAVKSVSSKAGAR